jgi:cell division protein FtsB
MRGGKTDETIVQRKFAHAMPHVVVSSTEAPRVSSEEARPRRVDAGTQAPPPRRGRRAQTAVSAPSPIRRRILNYVLALVTVVLVVDALVGDKGLLETVRARRQYAELVSSLAGLRQQNTQLRDDIRRLKEDPATIESIAREELGLMRPGELLFVVKDADRTH